MEKLEFKRLTTSNSILPSVLYVTNFIDNMLYFFFKCRALSDIDEATITATEDNLFAAGDYTKEEKEMEICVSEPPAEEPCVSQLPETYTK